MVWKENIGKNAAILFAILAFIITVLFPMTGMLKCRTTHFNAYFLRDQRPHQATAQYSGGYNFYRMRKELCYGLVAVDE
jgi:hypothetical protein